MYGGTAEQLRAYSVNISPPKRDWVPVGDDVFFCQVTIVANRDMPPVKTVWAPVVGGVTCAVAALSAVYVNYPVFGIFEQ